MIGFFFFSQMWLEEATVFKWPDVYWMPRKSYILPFSNKILIWNKFRFIEVLQIFVKLRNNTEMLLLTKPNTLFGLHQVVH